MIKTKPTLTKAQGTREKIIKACIKIIATQGVEKATTREISKHAKVANGLVTHYLKSQDELFPNVIQYIAQAAYNEIEAAPEELEPARKIIWMCEKNIDFFIAHPDYAKCFILFYYYASIDTSLRALNEALDKRAISRLEGYFQTISTNPKQAAIGIHSQIMSAAIRLHTVPLTGSQQEYREELLQRCQRMISNTL